MFETVKVVIGYKSRDYKQKNILLYVKIEFAKILI